MVKPSTTTPESASNPFVIHLGDQEVSLGLSECAMDLLTFDEICEIGEQTRKACEIAMGVNSNISVPTVFHALVNAKIEEKLRHARAMQVRHEQTS